MTKLTHVDEAGAARMVDVGHKPRRTRRAIARGEIRVSLPALQAIITETTPKGDVLAVARIAGIMAAKRTSDLIPLCHNLSLTSVKVDLNLDVDESVITIVSEVQTIERTGVEMEALMAVSGAALTLYDMLKAIDKSMVISDIRLVEKVGGKSDWHESANSGPERQVPTSSVALSVVPKRPMPGALLEPPSDSEVLPAPELAGAAANGSSSDCDEELSISMIEDFGGDGPSRKRRRRPAARPTADAQALIPHVRALEPDDYESLRRYLTQDRVGAAYLLGDLDQPYVEQTQWFGMFDPDDGALDGVLLLYTGLRMPTVLTVGDVIQMEALFGATLDVLPRRFYVNILREHRRALDVYYRGSLSQEVYRMGLGRAEYTREAEPVDVDLLTHRDTAAIMRLYTHYPDNFFEPAHLDSGLYFGIREGGELVSVAGAHVISETHDVAVVGNTVTHSDKRKRGLARRCVTRVLDELFPRVSRVALNVPVGNGQAISVYSGFGFYEHSRFIEGWVDRR